MPPEDDGNAGKPNTGADSGGAGNKPTGGGDSDELTRMRAALQKANAEAKKSREEADALKASIADGKSDAERVAATLTELKARADAADLRAMRAEVAAAKGLTPKQAARLQGSTIEELEADADDLVAAFAPAEGAGDGNGDAGNGNRRTAGAGRPREQLRPGASPPADQGEAFDVNKVVASIPF